MLFLLFSCFLFILYLMWAAAHNPTNVLIAANVKLQSTPQHSYYYTITWHIYQIHLITLQHFPVVRKNLFRAIFISAFSGPPFKAFNYLFSITVFC